VSVGAKSSIQLLRRPVTVGRLPFPEQLLLQLVLLHKPMLFADIKYSYLMMLFTMLFIACSVMFSFLYIFMVRNDEKSLLNKPPQYLSQPAERRCSWFVGELHHPTKSIPSEQPGSPFTNGSVHQNRGVRRHRIRQNDVLHVPVRRTHLGASRWRYRTRPSGLVLEVKRFCHKV
jgi:hypothetical protein